MTSRSMRPGAAADRLGLTVVMTLEGHDPPVAYDDDRTCIPPTNRITIFYFPGGEKMIGGSDDKTVQPELSDLQSGKDIDEVRIDCEQEVRVVAGHQGMVDSLSTLEDISIVILPVGSQPVRLRQGP
ncbi:hypothetical protein K503DRAFT_772636 [Rhizopogon vinicolor AM-OR11-026]|uniref:Uncharacterized protein n=1 Tax=Rhizopogon vinicolor AM-OR11-026 TaxID=1314800 RepID=A0A1B7MUS1_9AGAM|nr:hypothetical protein K503DRAFT_772636 [Rhizopogon vinicolor AM-OR11-026]